jgi:anti-sigma regulatory factor (Ser/Thr protein kinase)
MYQFHHSLMPVLIACHRSDVLEHDTFSVPVARDITRNWLTCIGLDEQIDVAELLVSELVTNAVRHAHGPVTLSLSASCGMVRCEVMDANPAPPCGRQAGDGDESGRGLQLIDVLAESWGSHPNFGKGKTVWFELAAIANAVCRKEFAPKDVVMRV